MNNEISDQQLLETLKRLERFAELTDSRFRIPFTKIHFGVDAIIGLIPFVGDFISLILSCYLLLEASKLGVPFSLKLRMFFNIITDWVIGLVPILGDAVDVFYKANNRNMKLLIEHINQDYQSRHASPAPEKPSQITKIGLTILCLVLGLLSLYAFIKYSDSLM